MSDDRPPLSKFVACRLWTRPGRDGSTFLSGRWGAARVLIVPNLDRADDDDATHLMILGEAEPTVRKPRKDVTP